MACPAFSYVCAYFESRSQIIVVFSAFYVDPRYLEVHRLRTN